MKFSPYAVCIDLRGLQFIGVKKKSTFSALSWMCCSGSFANDKLDRGLLKALCHTMLLWAVNSLYVPLKHYNENTMLTVLSLNLILLILVLSLLMFPLL